MSPVSRPSLEGDFPLGRNTQDQEIMDAQVEVGKLQTCLFHCQLQLTTSKFGFVALAILQTALLALFSRSHDEYRALLLASATLQFFAAVLMGLLSHLEHIITVRPSFLLSSYLVLTVILDAARARTQALIAGQNTVAGILIATVITKLLLFLVETKDKVHILLPEFSELSSELRSGLLSRALFLWLNPLLIAGFKGVLSSRSLPTIYERLSSELLTARVESRWKKGKCWCRIGI